MDPSHPGYVANVRVVRRCQSIKRCKSLLYGIQHVGDPKGKQDLQFIDGRVLFKGMQAVSLEEAAAALRAVVWDSGYKFEIGIVHPIRCVEGCPSVIQQYMKGFPEDP